MSSSFPLLGQQFTLNHGDQELVIDEVGARLHSYTVGGQSVIEPGEPKDGIVDAYKGAHGNLLMPWPNRVDKGAYTFEGGALQLPINEVARGHASHGFARSHAFGVESHSDSGITLSKRFYAQVGYPFVFDASVTYTLSDEGLKVTILAVNCCTSALPFGVGMHPYFSAELTDTVTIAADEYDEVNDVQIPVGDPKSVEGTAYDLRDGQEVSGLDLDTPLTGLYRDEAGNNVSIIASADGTRSTTVWMDESFGYIMIYTGSKPSVAIEPMSCAPDAFNNGRGLRILKEGESFMGSWGVKYTA